MLRRHVLQHDQRAARQLRDGARHVGAFVQIDLLDADAVIAGGLDPRDVIHQRGQLALVQRQDAVLDVLRAHPVVGPDDADDRNVDLGKDVDRHAQRRRRRPAGRRGSGRRRSYRVASTRSRRTTSVAPRRAPAATARGSAPPGRRPEALPARRRRRQRRREKSRHDCSLVAPRPRTVVISLPHKTKAALMDLHRQKNPVAAVTMTAAPDCEPPR